MKRNEQKHLDRIRDLCAAVKKVWWRGIGRTPIFGINDWASRFPAVAAQWDAEKNGCAPEEACSGSLRRYWWRCKKGHSWQALIKNQIDTWSVSCPYCTGQCVLPGDNDLQTLRPDLAAEWDTAKNFPLRPNVVTPESSLPVFWRCKLEHSYLAEISRRADGKDNCPYCAGKKALPGYNDLKTMCPEVAAEWHPTLNGDLRPKNILYNSARKAWWQCAKGHQWQAVIRSRTGASRTGCPECDRQHCVI